jgi:hypothetical protein
LPPSYKFLFFYIFAEINGPLLLPATAIAIAQLPADNENAPSSKDGDNNNPNPQNSPQYLKIHLIHLKFNRAFLMDYLLEQSDIDV